VRAGEQQRRERTARIAITRSLSTTSLLSVALNLGTLE
jgi:hypothetical protein